MRRTSCSASISINCHERNHDYQPKKLLLAANTHRAGENVAFGVDAASPEASIPDNDSELDVNSTVNDVSNSSLHKMKNESVPFLAQESLPEPSRSGETTISLSAYVPFSVSV